MNEPHNGGPVVELALTVAKLSETVARQGERISQLESAIHALMQQTDDEIQTPSLDLAGRPIR